MYEEAQMKNTAGLIAGGNLISHRNTTVAENIDNRIASLKEQIERLEGVKHKLESGRILNVPLDDLQMAMSRY